MDPTVRIGGDSGKPIVISQPDTPAAQVLQSIAEKIAAQLSMKAIKNATILGEE
jgi:ATP-binding protein involved in chromosome partitioning